MPETARLYSGRAAQLEDVVAGGHSPLRIGPCGCLLIVLPNIQSAKRECFIIQCL